jgi:hypothetical protein
LSQDLNTVVGRKHTFSFDTFGTMAALEDSSTLVVTELPPHTTSESLIASIEDASRKGKLKVKSIDDFTAGKVEIQINTPRTDRPESPVPRPERHPHAQPRLPRLSEHEAGAPVAMALADPAPRTEDNKKEGELTAARLMDWGTLELFKDPLTTMAAIDRPVHHLVILEFSGESVRGRKAKENQAG